MKEWSDSELVSTDQRRNKGNQHGHTDMKTDDSALQVVGKYLLCTTHNSNLQG